MSAKFPRHLAATKVYLHELVPALLPESPSTNLYFSPDAIGETVYQPATKKRRGTTAFQDTKPVLTSVNFCTDSLTKFLTTFVERTIDVLTEARDQLPSLRLDPLKRDPESMNSSWRSSHLQHHRHRHQPLHLAVLTRLIFVDLCTCAQQLRRDDRFAGLFPWLRVLSSLGLGLVSLGHHGTVSTVRTGPSVASPRKLLFMALKAEHLYFGKTAEEQAISERLTTTIQSLVSQAKDTTDAQVGNQELLVTTALDSILHLLTCTIAPETVADARPGNTKVISGKRLLRSADRISPIQAVLLQPASGNRDEVVRLLATLFSDRKGGVNLRLDDSNPLGPSGLATTNIVASGVVSQPPEARFTSTLASASIRVRALLHGVSLCQARSRVCVIFRRPDFPSQWAAVSGKPMSLSGALSGSWSQNFHPWWPPAAAWRRLDDTPPTMVDLQRLDKLEEDVEFTGNSEETDKELARRGWLELRTHLELTAGRWSEAGTVEMGLGYRLPMRRHCQIDRDDVPSDSVVLPLIGERFLARVKLIPCASTSSL